MHTAIFAGQYGFNARSFAVSSLHRQAAFHLGRAFSISDERREKEAEAIRAAADMGATIQPTPTPETLIDAFAASVRLLIATASLVDPVKGQPQTWLLMPDPATGKRKLIPLSALLDDQRNWLLNRDAQQVKAEATMTGADPTTRLAALRAESDLYWSQRETQAKAMYTEAMKRVNAMDYDALINTCVDGLAAAGLNIDAELQAGAKAYIDKMKSKMEAGQRTFTDPGIWAIAQGKRPTSPVLEPVPVTVTPDTTTHKVPDKPRKARARKGIRKALAV